MTKYANGIDNRCLVCGTPDSDKPMTFRKTDHCSDDHRKIISGEVTARDGEEAREAVVSMQVGIGIRLFKAGPLSRNEAARIVDQRPLRRERGIARG